MTLTSNVRTSVVAVLLLAVDVTAVIAAERPSNEWLRGFGEELEICLRGEVFDFDGQATSNLQVTGNLNATVADQSLKATVEGHRFEIWIPVSKLRWYSLWLRAESADSDRVAYKQMNAYELRQAAIDGIKLTLETPTRRVNVKVTDQGGPVSGATVKAELGFGVELRSTTDANGIAQLALLPRQEMSFLTAWTDDHRIGGFTFSRTPPRDPEADEHVIELSKCRDQKLRFIGEDGSPAPGVRFTLQIATPPPDFNYIGSPGLSQMTTDAGGEAVDRWFPDWDKVHFYADVEETNWYVEGEPKLVDGVAIFKLKKRTPRKRITGHVISTGTATGFGGFYVSLMSFQGERENHSDIDTGFSNRDGTFALDVLPDATYCAYVLDAKWVGKLIDLIPYESAGDKLTPPELAIAEGQPLEVVVTSGANEKPLADISVHFRREHNFQWQENGETKNGSGGPQWWATTDETGRAETRTLLGKLTASIYTPRWQTEKEITVVANEPATIALHREIGEKHTFAGRVVPDERFGGSLADVDIRIGSVDGNYEDQQSPKCNADGSFSIETYAAEVGIFASTRDGKMAGSIVTKEVASPIELRLQPTGEYHGQLLGAGDQPAVNHPVRAYLRLEGTKAEGARFPELFDVKRIETKTDEHGNFTLQRLPHQIKGGILADAVDGSDDEVYIGGIYLEPNETRPRTVSHLVRNEATERKVPLSERYQTTLRDCALAGYRPIVIVADDSDGVIAFVNRNYANYDVNKDVYPFMPIVVSAGNVSLEPADAAFLQERKWPPPQAGRIIAYALDTDGKVIGRQEVDVDDSSAANQVATFIHQHAPAPEDAEEKWTAAFAEAKRTNRRVWVRVSQRYCGPCFRMSRWLDDQRKLLEKDYVMLKIDDLRDKNGNDVAQRLYRGQGGGVPFHAIFDASGTMLIDSVGPLGNIGKPSGPEGKQQLRKMLLKTRQDLADVDIDQFVESTGD